MISRLKAYAKTCFFLGLFHLGLVYIAKNLTLHPLNLAWSKLFIHSKDLIGFHQFLAQGPRRLVFFIYGLTYCLLWLRFEKIETFSLKASELLTNLSAFLKGLSLIWIFYLSSEIFYFSMKILVLKPCSIRMIVMSALMIIPFSALTSFLEELVFRKILLESFERTSGHFFIANILQSLCFALGHIQNRGTNILRFLSWICFGLAAGSLKKNTEHLGIPIGFHTGFHLICIFQPCIEHSDLRVNGSFILYICIFFLILAQSTLKIQTRSKDTIFHHTEKP